MSRTSLISLFIDNRNVEDVFDTLFPIYPTYISSFSHEKDYHNIMTNIMNSIRTALKLFSNSI